jgi:hypothetical protein
MEKLLLLVRHVPDDILFFTCPRLRRKPFRWAPSTLMTRSPTMVDTSDNHQRAECTPDGLITRQRYLELSGEQQGQDGLECWCLEPETKTIYSIYWDAEAYNNPGKFSAVIVRPVEDDQYLQPEPNQVVDGVAVLFESGIEIESRTEGTPKASFAGMVTMIQRVKNEVPEGIMTVQATWKTETVCIT